MSKISYVGLLLLPLFTMSYNFTDRFNRLGNRMREVNNSRIRYHDGFNTSEEILATVYELVPDDRLPFGTVVSGRVRDYIITTNHLRINQTLIIPEQGHTIIDGNLQCLVTPLGEEPCFRYTSHQRITMRIHTKVIDEDYNEQQSLSGSY